MGIRKIKSKSMCSHKSFIPALSDLEEIQFWISSMCLELDARMQSEFEETERWPRTIALGFYGGRKAWLDQQEQEHSSSFRAPHKGSRSMPLGTRFDYGGVEGMARKMYGVVEKLIKEAETGRGRPILPLVLLTVTVSNFSDGHESAMGDITKFFSKAPVQPRQAQPSSDGIKEQNERPSEDKAPGQDLTSGTVETVTLPVKASGAKELNARRRFFQPRGIEQGKDNSLTGSVQHLNVESNVTPGATAPSSPPASGSRPSSPAPQGQSEIATETIHCDQCPSPGQAIPVEDWEEHTDYHFALRLLEDDRKQQQIERQQQAGTSHGNNVRAQGVHTGSKRNSPSSSNASSTRGKRKKTATVSAASGSASPNVSASLSKFFKPSTS